MNRTIISIIVIFLLFNFAASFPTKQEHIDNNVIVQKHNETDPIIDIGPVIYEPEHTDDDNYYDADGVPIIYDPENTDDYYNSESDPILYEPVEIVQVDLPDVNDTDIIYY
jgi:hypothetical protein